MNGATISVVIFFTFVAGFIFALFLSSRATDKIIKIHRDSSEQSMKDAMRAIEEAGDAVLLAHKYKSAYFSIKAELEAKGIEITTTFEDGSTMEELAESEILWPEIIGES